MISLQNVLCIRYHSPGNQSEGPCIVVVVVFLSRRNKETFRVYVVMPLLPAFEGQLGTSTGLSIQAVIHWNYQSIAHGGTSLLERLAKIGPVWRFCNLPPPPVL